MSGTINRVIPAINRVIPVINRVIPAINAVDKNCALLLCYYFFFIYSEDGTDRLSRNVGKKLPLLAA